MSSELTAVIARLEAATEGSVELSAIIARDVMGHIPHDWPLWFRGPSFDGRNDAVVPVEPYTTSLDAALTLVPKNISYELAFSAAGEGAMRRARLWDWRRGPLMIDPTNEWAAEAATLPLALCIAALRARAASEMTP